MAVTGENHGHWFSTPRINIYVYCEANHELQALNHQLPSPSHQSPVTSHASRLAYVARNRSDRSHPASRRSPCSSRERRRRIRVGIRIRRSRTFLRFLHCVDDERIWSGGMCPQGAPEKKSMARELGAHAARERERCRPVKRDCRFKELQCSPGRDSPAHAESTWRAIRQTRGLFCSHQTPPAILDQSVGVTPDVRHAGRKLS